MGKPLYVEGKPKTDEPTRSEPPLTAREPIRSNILRDALHAAEVERGRAIANPVLAVARDVAITEPSPVVGSVVFEARFDGSGRVVDVRYVSSSAEKRAWEAMKSALRAALSERPLRMPQSASRGIVVSFAVESTWLSPSHRSPGIEIGLPLLPPIKTGNDGGGERSKITATSLPRHYVAAGNSEGTGPRDIHNLLPRPNEIEVDVAIGTNFDPADFSAKPQRQVRARIVSERLL